MRKDRTQPTEFLVARVELAKGWTLILDHHEEITHWWREEKEWRILLPADKHAPWSITDGFLGWL